LKRQNKLFCGKRRMRMWPESRYHFIFVFEFCAEYGMNSLAQVCERKLV